MASTQDTQSIQAAQDKHGRNTRKPRGRHRTLKILLVLIVLLAAAIAGVVAYSYKTTLDSLSVTFTEASPEVEVGGDYSSMDYVSSSVGEVEASADMLDADTVGDKTITFTVTQPMYAGLLVPTQEFTMDYSVVDTEDPIIMWNGSGTVIQKGTEFDINNVLAYGDNADPTPSVTVDGTVDTETNGSYQLHVTVTDASGNSDECDMTITVADSVPTYTDDYPRTQFKDFTSAYKGKDRSFGLDVSVWQGDIDFEKVADSGCEFVMIRVGYSSEGDMTVDSKFEQNLERAKAAGLKVGVYLYCCDNSETTVRASADRVLEELGGAELDLPVAFDWEDFGRFQSYEISFAQLNDLYDYFADEISTGGYDCMLYGNKNALELVWKDTDTRPVWLANYTDKTEYKGPYRIWQASSTGRIDGIDADVDMDIMYE